MNDYNLDLNRKGVMTLEQRWHLLRAGVLQLLPIGVIITLVIGGLTSLASTISANGLSELGRLLNYALTILLAIGSGFFMARNGVSKLLDAMLGKVVQSDGLLHKWLEETSGPHAYCNLGQQTLYVPSDLYGDLIEGLPYRVYYAPRSNSLLSAETRVT